MILGKNLEMVSIGHYRFTEKMFQLDLSMFSIFYFVIKYKNSIQKPFSGLESNGITNFCYGQCRSSEANKNEPK